MKYFKNTANGMPLYHDDFRFIQDGLIEAIENLAKGFTFEGKNFIITGCTTSPDGNNLHVDAGWVYLDGELLYYSGGTIFYDSSKYYIYQKQTSNNSAGERLVNGVLFNPYQENTAKIQEVSTLPSDALDIFGLRLEQVLSKKMLFVPQWKKVGESGNLQLENNFEIRQPPYGYGLQYKLTNSGDLHIFGDFKITIDLSAGDTLIFINLLNTYQFASSAFAIITGGLSESIYENEKYRIELHYQKASGEIDIFNLTFQAKENLTTDTPFNINLFVPLNIDNSLKYSTYDN